MGRIAAATRAALSGAKARVLAALPASAAGRDAPAPGSAVENAPPDPDDDASVQAGVAMPNRTTGNYCGWLHKWTNYLSGYRLRWVVLEDGCLMYFRSREDVNMACRGVISMASVEITQLASLDIILSMSGGDSKLHFRAHSVAELNRWLGAMKTAKEFAAKGHQRERQHKMLTALSRMERKKVDGVADDDDEDEEEETEEEETDPEADESETDESRVTQSPEDPTEMINTLLASLRTQLESLRRRERQVGEQVNAHCATLATTASGALDQIRALHNVTGSLIEECARFVDSIGKNTTHWAAMMKHQSTRRRHLERTVEALSKEQYKFQRRMTLERAKAVSSIESDDEFFDADDVGNELEFPLVVGASSSGSAGGPPGPNAGSELASGPVHEPTTAALSVTGATVPVEPAAPAPSTAMAAATGAVVPDRRARPYRERIPYKPDKQHSLWSVMKSCIGKDLSKIPVPVFFNEPLSFLQRLSEDLEYSELLDQACGCSTSTERMAYVAAFTVSSYASTATRTGKPFNPLLGETYELDLRATKGWRSIAEQVMHHPPISAQHADSANWTYWQDFGMKSKFRGNYLEIVPTGVAHLLFKQTGELYSWRKVTSVVQNIIVGKLWIDQYGDMTITNHTTGDTCLLTYIAYSYFSRARPRALTGVIKDRTGTVVYEIRGYWDDMCGYRPVGADESALRIIWRRNPLPADSTRMYGFTTFAALLNEPDDRVPPTDSRLRPDQRLMENGQWDEADKEKQRLEEKQRKARREREARHEEWTPRWFEVRRDRVSGMSFHHYKACRQAHVRRRRCTCRVASLTDRLPPRRAATSRCATGPITPACRTYFECSVPAPVAGGGGARRRRTRGRTRMDRPVFDRCASSTAVVPVQDPGSSAAAAATHARTHAHREAGPHDGADLPQLYPRTSACTHSRTAPGRPTKQRSRRSHVRSCTERDEGGGGYFPACGSGAG